MRVQVTDSTTNVSSGIRSIAVSTSFGNFLTVDEVNILSSNRTRYPVTSVSRAYLEAIYPSQRNITGIPEFYAMISDNQVLLGPAPDHPRLSSMSHNEG